MPNEPTESDYSIRILWSLARWIEDEKGSVALATVAASIGVSAADFDSGSMRWLSHAQVETVLQQARALAGDEETFRSIFAHRFVESYGVFRYVVWAVSQQKMCELAASMVPKLLTHVGRVETLYSTANTFGLRYSSARPESRLMCISRQVPWATSPTLNGLPSGEIVERACMANGDPYCEYHVRWLDERGIVPVLVGLTAGVAAAFAASWVDPSYTSTAVLPLFGAALGYLREMRRVTKVYVAQAEGRGTAMRVLAEAEAETRSEIVALQQRQDEWSSRMEQEANERNATLEKVVGGLDDLQQSRVSSIRGFSHDLRNPLFVVRANTELLRARLDDRELADQGDDGEILQDMDAASVQIESMLAKLMEVATAETAVVKLVPQPVAVLAFADTLRRRLKALVYGRGIEVSVVCTHDAPGTIVIDPLVFDRVVDNLLTNAAKYTARGSIKLVLGGDEHESLTLVLSDTGCGIAEDQIDRIFRPRPAHEPKGPNSYGIGLSSAVRLLGQIGGQLAVTSQLGVGTTFSASFPKTPPAPRRAGVGDDSMESVIARVVKVPKTAA